MALAPDPLAGLGSTADIFKNPVQLAWINSFVRVIRDRLSQALMRDTAAPYFILQSPNGTSYKVSVNDQGTIAAAAISRN